MMSDITIARSGPIGHGLIDPVAVQLAAAMITSNGSSEADEAVRTFYQVRETLHEHEEARGYAHRRG